MNEDLCDQTIFKHERLCERSLRWKPEIETRDTGFRRQETEVRIQRPQEARHETGAISAERNAPVAPPWTPTPNSQSQMPASIEPQMPVDGAVSSKFGIRKHPIHGDHRFHHGIDIAAPEGTDVYPYRSGTVIFSGQQPGYGNTVVIDHGDAHNRVNMVKAGDRVDENTVIAEVGSTGVSTGPHLHFEVRQDGKPLDPATFLAMR